MTDAPRSLPSGSDPRVLLEHHLKTLKLPTFQREYDKLARQCASEGVDHVRYLHRLAELELIDVSHPGATHESTGFAARSVEREIEQGGETPDMGYGFLSDFLRIGIDGWTKFGTTGHPQGHCTLEGYMGLRPDDPDTNEYVRLMYESHGEERAEEILGVNLHHVLIYPCNSVQPPLQQLRTIRPLAPDKTLSEIWQFRLVGAPDAIYQRSLAYYYLVNSPSTLVNADDLFNWWKCQNGLDSEGGEWVSFHRNAGQDIEREGILHSTPDSMSEMPLRSMAQAWKRLMTANGIGE